MAAYKRGRPWRYNPGSGSGNEPPSRAGEYRIRNSDGDLSYLGETCNLRRRMGQHRRSGLMGDGDTFEYQIADGRSSSRTRRSHEIDKINCHKPSRNRRGGGGGRRAR